MKQLTRGDVWRHILSLVLPYKWRFVLIVGIGLLGTASSLVEPLIYREAINDVAGLFVKQAKEQASDSTSVGSEDDSDPITEAIAQKLDAQIHPKKEPHSRSHVAERSPAQALETLLIAAGLIFLVNVFGYILTLIGENMNIKLSCLVEQRFIHSTFIHVLRLPLGFFAKRSSAAISKQVNQSEEVSAIITGFSQQILPELISLMGILAIMFWQNVTLSLISVAVIPFYLFIAWRSAIKLEASLSLYYERWEDVYARMQDALAGIKTVKLSGAEKREAENLKKIAGSAYKEYIERSKLGNKYVFWENTLVQVSSVLVLGYGGYLTLEHKLTPGDVVMFVSYLDRLYRPLDSLTTLWVNLQQNFASITRAFRLLDNGMEEKQGAEIEIAQGRVEFKDVHFRYNPEREILRGLNFTLEPGKITAIVGSSGAGKTTTVDLLMKLYDPTSGKILIDGQDLGALSSSSVRSYIGMVSADGAIFRGTLADNIRYKRPQASDDEVMSAAMAAGMHATLDRFPEGLNTPVGESGMGLSVGERQRVQIARVLISKPRILILDEATANLDYATESEIRKTVEQLRKESTVVVIAHRYSMVKNADHVIVLSAGEVLEEGTPQELIAKKGWFAGFAAAAEEKPMTNPTQTGLVEDQEEQED